MTQTDDQTEGPEPHRYSIRGCDFELKLLPDGIQLMALGKPWTDAHEARLKEINSQIDALKEKVIKKAQAKGYPTGEYRFFLEMEEKLPERIMIHKLEKEKSSIFPGKERFGMNAGDISRLLEEALRQVRKIDPNIKDDYYAFPHNAVQQAMEKEPDNYDFSTLDQPFGIFLIKGFEDIIVKYGAPVITFHSPHRSDFELFFETQNALEHICDRYADPAVPLPKFDHEKKYSPSSYEATVSQGKIFDQLDDFIKTLPLNAETAKKLMHQAMQLVTLSDELELSKEKAASALQGLGLENSIVDNIISKLQNLHDQYLFYGPGGDVRIT